MTNRNSEPVMSEPPKNFGKKMTPVLAGTPIQTGIYSGWVRRDAPEDGFVVETNDEETIFIPKTMVMTAIKESKSATRRRRHTEQT